MEGACDATDDDLPAVPVAGDNSHPVIFERGKQYIVVAHRLTAGEQMHLGLAALKGLFGTDACGDGSRALSAAAPDLGAIGPGRQPVDMALPVRNPVAAAPLKIRDAVPVYPEGGREAGIRGLAIVELTVDTAGNVVGPKILRSFSPDREAAVATRSVPERLVPLFDHAAIDCVMKWRFLPALINNVPVPSVMTAVVRFAP